MLLFALNRVSYGNGVLRFFLLSLSALLRVGMHDLGPFFGFLHRARGFQAYTWGISC